MSTNKGYFLFPDLELTPEGKMTFSTKEDSMDIFILMGPSPESVVQQYTSVGSIWVILSYRFNFTVVSKKMK